MSYYDHAVAMKLRLGRWGTDGNEAPGPTKPKWLGRPNLIVRPTMAAVRVIGLSGIGALLIDII